MKVRLVLQFNRGKEIHRDKVKPLDDVEIDLDRNGVALAARGGTILYRLVKARVDTISKDGLLISGLEEHPVTGSLWYYHQEWWCVTSAD